MGLKHTMRMMPSLLLALLLLLSMKNSCYDSSRPLLSKSSNGGEIRDHHDVQHCVGSILVLSPSELHHPIRMSTNSTVNARMLAGSTPPPGKSSYNSSRAG
jgi:hypothetical protein